MFARAIKTKNNLIGNHRNEARKSLTEFHP